MSDLTFMNTELSPLSDERQQIQIRANLRRAADHMARAAADMQRLVRELSGMPPFETDIEDGLLKADKALAETQVEIAEADDMTAGARLAVLLTLSRVRLVSQQAAE